MINFWLKVIIFFLIGACFSRVANACETNFEMTSGEHVPAIISGSTTVYLDTGSSVSVLPLGKDTDNSIVAEDVRMYGYNNSFTAKRYGPIRTDTLGCSDLKISPVSIDINTASNIDPLLSQISEENNQILLGRDSLSQRIVVFDFKAMEVKFKAVEKTAVARDRVLWPYMIDIDFRGNSFSCVLDTGLSGRATIYVPYNHHISQELKKQKNRYIQSSHSASRSGLVQDFYSKESRIKGLSGTGIVFSVEQLKASSEDNTDLQRFCVVGVDMAQDSTITISPMKQKAEISGELPIPEYNRLGIAAISPNEAGDEFYVSAIIENSSAHEAGILIGDTIKSVNGITLGKANMSVLSDQIYAPAGTISLFEIYRNNSIIKTSITNSDYLAHN